MARPIDADLLYDKVESRYRVSSGIEHRCERDFLDLICAAPTIAALRGPTREQVEKAWRGEWTGNFNAHCSLCDTFSTMAYIGQGGNFCPNCGSPMTDEAVEILLKRLEALK